MVRSFGMTLIFLIAFIAAAMGAVHEAIGEPSDSSLPNELAALDTKLAAIRDMTAAFTERKVTALLKKPLVSHGKVQVKPPQMRWETTSPRRSVLTMDESAVRILYPDQNIIEVYALGKQLRIPAMSPLPRLADLREHFELTLAPDAKNAADTGDEQLLGVRLTPREESLSEHIVHVDVWIDRETACAFRIVMLDRDGDRTEIEFSDVRTDTGLTGADMAMTPPASAKVVYPLGAVDDAVDSAAGDR